MPEPLTQVEPVDRLFWLTLRRLWSKWASVLLIVKSETVVSRHRASFR
jgi:hypothetical protein